MPASRSRSSSRRFDSRSLAPPRAHARTGRPRCTTDPGRPLVDRPSCRPYTGDRGRRTEGRSRSSTPCPRPFTGLHDVDKPAERGAIDRMPWRGTPTPRRGRDETGGGASRLDGRPGAQAVLEAVDEDLENRGEEKALLVRQQGCPPLARPPRRLRPGSRDGPHRGSARAPGSFTVQETALCGECTARRGVRRLAGREAEGPAGGGWHAGRRSPAGQIEAT